MKTIRETARNIPLIRECDVIVCGGGPAGIAAAIASARAGAKTQLIELRGCLGGVWTAGLLSWIIDGKDKTSIMQEIIQRLSERDACTIDEIKYIDFEQEPDYIGLDLERDFSYDAEVMKHILEEMALEAGVSVRLHTRVVAASRTDKNHVDFIVTESKSGREAWRAKTYIDATGDGDLAAQLGCTFQVGEPNTGKMQPMTLMTLVTGIHAKDVKNYITDWHAGLNPPKKRLFDTIQTAGITLSYTKPALFRIRDDLFAMAINHEYGVSGMDANDLTRATISARREIHAAIDALRSCGGIWENLRIVATAEQIGVREGRRVQGRYTVTKEDLIEGKRHPNPAVHVTFPVDIHVTDPLDGRAFHEGGVTALPYDIPVEALIAQDIDGLLLAGRCISGDFIAHGSYRVTGNAVAMGETAGVVAAIATQHNILPHEVKWEDIHTALQQPKYD